MFIFIFEALLLLKNKGVLCFICSSSWLDVGFGSRLQEVLLRKSRIKSIYDNNSVRSFEKADVNTTINLFIKDLKITLNEDPATKKKSLKSSNISRFISFYHDFELVAITNEIEIISNTRKIVINDKWRSYPIEQSQLYENGLDEKFKYEGDKWIGKYLRSPSILLELIENKISNKLSDYGDISLGLTSCQNDFFYLNDVIIKEYNLPSKYLFHIFKTPTESDRIFVSEDQFKNKVLIYNKEVIEKSVEEYLKYGINIGIPEVECLKA